MERDEHEMLIEYSEMTSFNFNSKEFQEVKRDYMECKNLLSNINDFILDIAQRFKPIRNY